MKSLPRIEKLSPENVLSKNPKIAAVVVTFNRKQLLQEALDSLLRQTKQIDKIIVVDNNSTDSTPELFSSVNGTFREIEYLRLSENTGGAGGFHSGVKWAFEKGYDWIWLMDDDVEAYPDALENLLKYADKSLCIHGQRTNLEGRIYNWEAHFNTKFGFAIPSADVSHRINDLCFVNVGCFEGMLIHRSVVAKIGFPDSRFFIAWDDTIYGFLASKWTDVSYVKQLSLKRKRPLKSIELGFRTFNEVSDLYRFYHIRNRKLVRKYLESEIQFSGFLFDLMTSVLFIKEIFRSILLQRNFLAYKPLIAGLRAKVE